MTVILVTVFISLSLFGCSQSAAGPKAAPSPVDTLYVNPALDPDTADRTGRGYTRQSPKATINAAWDEAIRPKSKVRRIVIMGDPDVGKEFDRKRALGRVVSVDPNGGDALFSFVQDFNEDANTNEITISGSNPDGQGVRVVAVRGWNSEGDTMRVMDVGHGAKIRLENIRITGGFIEGDGGGIYVGEGGSLVIGQNCVIEKNAASSGRGNGIFMSGGTVAITGNAEMDTYDEANPNDIYIGDEGKVTVRGKLEGRAPVAILTIPTDSSRYVLAGSLKDLSNTQGSRNFELFQARVVDYTTPGPDGRYAVLARYGYNTPYPRAIDQDGYLETGRTASLTFYVDQNPQKGFNGTGDTDDILLGLSQDRPFRSLSYALQQTHNPRRIEVLGAPVRRIEIMESGGGAYNLGMENPTDLIAPGKGYLVFDSEARYTDVSGATPPRPLIGSSEISITGTRGRDVHLQSAPGYRAFMVKNSAKVVFEHITLTGNAQGSGDDEDSKGGAIYVDTGASVTLGDGAIISGSTASFYNVNDSANFQGGLPVSPQSRVTWSRGVYVAPGAHLALNGTVHLDADNDIFLSYATPITLLGPLYDYVPAAAISLEDESRQIVLVGDILASADRTGQPNYRKFSMNTVDKDLRIEVEGSNGVVVPGVRANPPRVTFKYPVPNNGNDYSTAWLYGVKNGFLSEDLLFRFRNVSMTSPDIVVDDATDWFRDLKNYFESDFRAKVDVAGEEIAADGKREQIVRMHIEGTLSSSIDYREFLLYLPRGLVVLANNTHPADDLIADDRLGLNVVSAVNASLVSDTPELDSARTIRGVQGQTLKYSDAAGNVNFIIALENDEILFETEPWNLGSASTGTPGVDFAYVPTVIPANKLGSWISDSGGYPTSIPQGLVVSVSPISVELQPGTWGPDPTRLRLSIGGVYTSGDPHADSSGNTVSGSSAWWKVLYAKVPSEVLRYSRQPPRVAESIAYSLLARSNFYAAVSPAGVGGHFYAVGSGGGAGNQYAHGLVRLAFPLNNDTFDLAAVNARRAQTGEFVKDWFFTGAADTVPPDFFAELVNADDRSMDIRVYWEETADASAGNPPPFRITVPGSFVKHWSLPDDAPLTLCADFSYDNPGGAPPAASPAPWHISAPVEVQFSVVADRASPYFSKVTPALDPMGTLVAAQDQGASWAFNIDLVNDSFVSPLAPTVPLTLSDAAAVSRAIGAIESATVLGWIRAAENVLDNQGLPVAPGTRLLDIPGVTNIGVDPISAADVPTVYRTELVSEFADEVITGVTFILNTGAGTIDGTLTDILSSGSWHVEVPKTYLLRSYSHAISPPSTVPAPPAPNASYIPGNNFAFEIVSPRPSFTGVMLHGVYNEELKVNQKETNPALRGVWDLEVVVSREQFILDNDLWGLPSTMAPDSVAIAPVPLFGAERWFDSGARPLPGGIQVEVRVEPPFLGGDSRLHLYITGKYNGTRDDGTYGDMSTPGLSGYRITIPPEFLVHAQKEVPSVGTDRLGFDLLGGVWAGTPGASAQLTWTTALAEPNPDGFVAIFGGSATGTIRIRLRGGETFLRDPANSTDPGSGALSSDVLDGARDISSWFSFYKNDGSGGRILCTPEMNFRGTSTGVLTDEVYPVNIHDTYFDVRVTWDVKYVAWDSYNDNRTVVVRVPSSAVNHRSADVNAFAGNPLSAPDTQMNPDFFYKVRKAPVITAAPGGDTKFEDRGGVKYLAGVVGQRASWVVEVDVENDEFSFLEPNNPLDLTQGYYVLPRDTLIREAENWFAHAGNPNQAPPPYNTTPGLPESVHVTDVQSVSRTDSSGDTRPTRLAITLKTVAWNPSANGGNGGVQSPETEIVFPAAATGGSPTGNQALANGDQWVVYVPKRYLRMTALSDPLSRVAGSQGLVHTGDTLRFEIIDQPTSALSEHSALHPLPTGISPPSVKAVRDQLIKQGPDAAGVVFTVTLPSGAADKERLQDNIVIPNPYAPSPNPFAPYLDPVQEVPKWFGTPLPGGYRVEFAQIDRYTITLTVTGAYNGDDSDSGDHGLVPGEEDADRSLAVRIPGDYLVHSTSPLAAGAVHFDLLANALAKADPVPDDFFARAGGTAHGKITISLNLPEYTDPTHPSYVIPTDGAYSWHTEVFDTAALDPLKGAADSGKQFFASTPIPPAASGVLFEATLVDYAPDGSSITLDARWSVGAVTGGTPHAVPMIVPPAFLTYSVGPIVDKAAHRFLLKYEVYEPTTAVLKPGPGAKTVPATYPAGNQVPALAGMISGPGNSGIPGFSDPTPDVFQRLSWTVDLVLPPPPGSDPGDEFVLAPAGLPGISPAVVKGWLVENAASAPYTFLSDINLTGVAPVPASPPVRTLRLTLESTGSFTSNQGLATYITYNDLYDTGGQKDRGIAMQAIIPSAYLKQSSADVHTNPHNHSANPSGITFDLIQPYLIRPSIDGHSSDVSIPLPPNPWPAKIDDPVFKARPGSTAVQIFKLTFAVDDLVSPLPTGTNGDVPSNVSTWFREIDPFGNPTDQWSLPPFGVLPSAAISAPAWNTPAPPAGYAVLSVRVNPPAGGFAESYAGDDAKRRVLVPAAVLKHAHQDLVATKAYTWNVRDDRIATLSPVTGATLTTEVIAGFSFQSEYRLSITNADLTPSDSSFTGLAVGADISSWFSKMDTSGAVPVPLLEGLPAGVAARVSALNVNLHAYEITFILSGTVAAALAPLEAEYVVNIPASHVGNSLGAPDRVGPLSTGQWAKLDITEAAEVVVGDGPLPDPIRLIQKRFGDLFGADGEIRFTIVTADPRLQFNSAWLASLDTGTILLDTSDSPLRASSTPLSGGLSFVSGGIDPASSGKTVIFKITGVPISGPMNGVIARVRFPAAAFTHGAFTSPAASTFAQSGETEPKNVVKLDIRDVTAVVQAWERPMTNGVLGGTHADFTSWVPVSDLSFVQWSAQHDARLVVTLAGDTFKSTLGPSAAAWIDQSALPAGFDVTKFVLTPVESGGLGTGYDTVWIDIASPPGASSPAVTPPPVPEAVVTRIALPVHIPALSLDNRQAAFTDDQVRGSGSYATLSVKALEAALYRTSTGTAESSITITGFDGQGLTTAGGYNDFYIGVVGNDLFDPAIFGTPQTFDGGNPLMAWSGWFSGTPSPLSRGMGATAALENGRLRIRLTSTAGSLVSYPAPYFTAYSATIPPGALVNRVNTPVHPLAVTGTVNIGVKPEPTAKITGTASVGTAAAPENQGAAITERTYYIEVDTDEFLPLAALKAATASYRWITNLPPGLAAEPTGLGSSYNRPDGTPAPNRLELTVRGTPAANRLPASGSGTMVFDDIPAAALKGSNNDITAAVDPASLGFVTWNIAEHLVIDKDTPYVYPATAPAGATMDFETAFRIIHGDQQNTTRWSAAYHKAEYTVRVSAVTGTANLSTTGSGTDPFTGVGGVAPFTLVSGGAGKEIVITVESDANANRTTTFVGNWNNVPTTFGPAAGESLLEIRAGVTVNLGKYLIFAGRVSAAAPEEEASDYGLFIVNGGALKILGAADGVTTGTIIRGNAAHYGGAVSVLSGTFDMRGGTIQDNSALSWSGIPGSGKGGGVYVDGGSFEFTGGTIGLSGGTIGAGGNLAGASGGGVFVGSGAFVMGGGGSAPLIAGNYANGANGGGVAVIGSGKMIFTSGAIIGNVAAVSGAVGGLGGGIYYDSSESLIIGADAGGSVSGAAKIGSTGGGLNIASGAGSAGAGIYVHAPAGAPLPAAGVVLAGGALIVAGNPVYLQQGASRGEFYPLRLGAPAVSEGAVASIVPGDSAAMLGEYLLVSAPGITTASLVGKFALASGVSTALLIDDGSAVFTDAGKLSPRLIWYVTKGGVGDGTTAARAAPGFNVGASTILNQVKSIYDPLTWPDDGGVPKTVTISVSAYPNTNALDAANSKINLGTGDYPPIRVVGRSAVASGYFSPGGNGIVVYDSNSLTIDSDAYVYHGTDGGFVFTVGGDADLTIRGNARVEIAGIEVEGNAKIFLKDTASVSRGATGIAVAMSDSAQLSTAAGTTITGNIQADAGSAQVFHGGTLTGAVSLRSLPSQNSPTLHIDGGFVSGVINLEVSKTGADVRYPYIDVQAPPPSPLRLQVNGVSGATIDDIAAISANRILSGYLAGRVSLFRLTNVGTSTPAYQERGYDIVDEGSDIGRLVLRTTFYVSGAGAPVAGNDTTGSGSRQAPFATPTPANAQIVTNHGKAFWPDKGTADEVPAIIDIAGTVADSTTQWVYSYIYNNTHLSSPTTQIVLRGNAGVGGTIASAGDILQILSGGNPTGSLIIRGPLTLQASGAESNGAVVKLGYTSPATPYSFIIEADENGAPLITGGYSGTGGGVYLDCSNGGGTIEMRGGSIRGNRSKNYGGGIYMGGGTLIVGGNASIKENSADIRGGGVYVENIVNTKVTFKGNARIELNRAGSTAANPGQGGGLYTGAVETVFATDPTLNGGRKIIVNIEEGATFIGNTLFDPSTGQGSGIFLGRSFDYINYLANASVFTMHGGIIDPATQDIFLNGVTDGTAHKQALISVDGADLATITVPNPPGPDITYTPWTALYPAGTIRARITPQIYQSASAAFVLRDGGSTALTNAEKQTFASSFAASDESTTGVAYTIADGTSGTTFGQLRRGITGNGKIYYVASTSVATALGVTAVDSVTADGGLWGRSHDRPLKTLSYALQQIYSATNQALSDADRIQTVIVMGTLNGTGAGETHNFTPYTSATDRPVTIRAAASADPAYAVISAIPAAVTAGGLTAKLDGGTQTGSVLALLGNDAVNPKQYQHLVFENITITRANTNTSADSLITMKVSGGTAAGLVVDLGRGAILDGNKAPPATAQTLRGGAAYVNGGTLNVGNNAVIKNAAAVEAGGGIYVGVGAKLTMNGTISDNRVTGTATGQGYGGGIYFAGGTGTSVAATLAGTIRGNSATARGGGVYLADSTAATAAPKVIQTGGVIDNNEVTCTGTVTNNEYAGAGVWVSDKYGVFTMSGGGVYNNHFASGKTGRGTGIFLAGSGTGPANNAQLYLSGNAIVDAGNDVYLRNARKTVAASAGNTIAVDGAFTGSASITVTREAYNDYVVVLSGGYTATANPVTPGTAIAAFGTAALATTAAGRFTVTPEIDPYEGLQTYAISATTPVKTGMTYLGPAVANYGRIFANAPAGGTYYVARNDVDFSPHTAGPDAYLDTKWGRGWMSNSGVNRDHPLLNFNEAINRAYANRAAGANRVVVIGRLSYDAWNATRADDGLTGTPSAVVGNKQTNNNGRNFTIADYDTTGMTGHGYTDTLLIEGLSDSATNGGAFAVPGSGTSAGPVFAMKRHTVAGAVKPTNIVFKNVSILGGRLLGGADDADSAAALTVDGGSTNTTANTLSVTLDTGAILDGGVTGYTASGATRAGGLYIRGLITNAHARVQVTMKTGAAIKNFSATGNAADKGAGGVLLLDSAEFHMEGGTISGNQALGATAYANGGGISIRTSTPAGSADFQPVFTLGAGAVITGNTAANNGGGIYTGGSALLYSGFTLPEGVEITNNAAKNGGGIYLSGKDVGLSIVPATVSRTMSGGLVYGNKAAERGGGIFVAYPAAAIGTALFPTTYFTMSGGTIQGNSTTGGGAGGGGGIYVESGTVAPTFSSGTTQTTIGQVGTFVMTGGLITGNTVMTHHQGAGVYVSGAGDVNAVFRMSAKAKVDPGNDVYLANADVDVPVDAQAASKRTRLEIPAPFDGTVITAAGSAARITPGIQFVGVYVLSGAALDTALSPAAAGLKNYQAIQLTPDSSTRFTIDNQGKLAQGALYVMGDSNNNASKDPGETYGLGNTRYDAEDRGTEPGKALATLKYALWLAKRDNIDLIYVMGTLAADTESDNPSPAGATSYTNSIFDISDWPRGTIKGYPGSFRARLYAGNLATSNNLDANPEYVDTGISDKRVISVRSSAAGVRSEVTFEDIDIYGGRFTAASAMNAAGKIGVGAGILVFGAADGDVTVTLGAGAKVLGNHADGPTGAGGGIFAERSRLVVSGGMVQNNSAVYTTTQYGMGGGVYLRRSTLSVLGGVIGGVVGLTGAGAYEDGWQYWTADGIPGSGTPGGTVATRPSAGPFAAGNRANAGGGVYAQNSTVTLDTGGLVQFNAAYITAAAQVSDTNQDRGGGGGILLYSPNTDSGLGGAGQPPSALVMKNSSAVRYNYAELLGGGVKDDSDNMAAGTNVSLTLGGDVSFNEAGVAGGLFSDSRTLVTIDGGTIRGNRATATDIAGFNAAAADSHRGFHAATTYPAGFVRGNAAGIAQRVLTGNNGSITMTSGAISGNSASADCGGVYVRGGTFTMKGGSVSANTGIWGGGFFLNRTNSSHAPVVLDMSGGYIFDNTATSGGGGGVFMENPAGGETFTFTGGAIGYNAANVVAPNTALPSNNAGPGVFVDSVDGNSFRMGGTARFNTGSSADLVTFAVTYPESSSNDAKLSFIDLVSNLTDDSGTPRTEVVAKISTTAAYTEGHRVLYTSNPGDAATRALVAKNYHLFRMEGGTGGPTGTYWSVTPEGKIGRTIYARVGGIGNAANGGLTAATTGADGAFGTIAEALSMSYKNPNNPSITIVGPMNGASDLGNPANAIENISTYLITGQLKLTGWPHPLQIYGIPVPSGASVGAPGELTAPSGLPALHLVNMVNGVELGNLILTGNGANVLVSIGDKANLTLRDSTVKNGAAVYTGDAGGDLGGAGVFFASGTVGVAAANQPVLTLNRSKVYGNVIATGKGGGIYARDAKVNILDNTVISENKATNGEGGGLYLRDSTLTMKNSVVGSAVPAAITTASTAAQTLGVLGVDPGNTGTYGAWAPLWTAVDAQIRAEGNEAGVGGGIYLFKTAGGSSSATFDSAAIAFNRATSPLSSNPADQGKGGGGIYSDGGDIFIARTAGSTLIGYNLSDNDGGGVSLNGLTYSANFIPAPTASGITKVQVFFNRAGNNGGGIYATGKGYSSTGPVNTITLSGAGNTADRPQLNYNWAMGTGDINAIPPQLGGMGGALYAQGYDVEIWSGGTELKSNLASSYGGAVWISKSPIAGGLTLLTIVNPSVDGFRANKAAATVAGGDPGGNSILLLKDTTVSFSSSSAPTQNLPDFAYWNQNIP